MDLTKRIDQAELMDTQTFPLPVMRETLSFLGVTTRYFGGAEVILHHLKFWSARWGGNPIRILDVGTGGAEIPMAIANWARSAGFKVEITAIDLVPEVVAVARENTRSYPEINVEQADVFELPRHPRRFDYVLASLLLHHVRPVDSVGVMRCFDALSTRGVIISDLLRTHSSYWAVTALSCLIGNHVVRHDGPLSVRRAFLPEELAALAVASELNYLKAQREPWFRVSLAGEKL